MKLAILGGSFNPVHWGHLFLADAALTRLGYDRVIFIPAFQSPFKMDAEGAQPGDRLDMLAASIAGDSRFTIDDCEIKREGVSYTADTLADIQRRYCPEGKPGLILGDDLAVDFHKWRKAEEIAERAGIIIARRLSSLPGFTFPWPYTALHNEVVELSSRMVREKIRKDEDWRYLVPSGARYIIEDRGLYGLRKGGGEPELPGFPGDAGCAETTVLLEDAARRALNHSRFLHSRNTALTARDLCVRFGLDPRAGYLAGIAHDFCKSMKAEDLLKLAKADGKAFSGMEQKNPSLTHGRAAAVLLKTRYGVTNTDILEAVRLHTTGAPGMGPLAQVLYISDKIEVSRENVSPRLREMLPGAGLDELFAAVLEDTTTYLRSRQLDISQATLRLLSAVRKKSL